MLEVVCLKNDVFTQRFKAEHGKDLENEEKMTAKIEQIRNELFSMSFEETGKDLINKFRQNFQRLRDFMSSVDKEISQLAVFNQKDDQTKEVDEASKHGGSVQQLRHILKNYEALTESQHHLLNQSITKMSKIPPPDEISATFDRFTLLKESEIDEFKVFLEDHKQVLSQQYREIDNERKNFEEMQRRMERERQVVSDERERIAMEVRKIREMNN
jgi:PAS domain-containing protein